VSESNPTSLVAHVNETSLDQSYLSILKLYSVSANVGTFLNLGRFDASRVSVTQPSAGNYTISASWDTRTPMGHMSDGLNSVWWPSLYAYAPFQSAVAGYWDNATISSPVPAAAVFDTRNGQLLYVYNSYGFFGPGDQPTSTFQPYASGVRIDMTSAAIVGYAIVNGPTFAVGNLRMDLSQAVPAGQYGAFLELYDSAGHYTPAAVLMQTTPDTVPPVANAGPDLVVNEDTTVTFDGSRSTDNVGIASYTWTFMDGTMQTLQGVTATHVFATPGTYIVSLTVRDADGNVGTDTVTVTVRDVTPPTVTISSPSDGASIPGSTVIVTSAADNVAVVRVEFLVDGVSVGNDTTAPFEWSIAGGSLRDGNHTLTVIAFDAAGNSASATVRVKVTNVPGGNGLGPLEVGGFIAILALIAGIVVVLFLIARRKPRRPSMVPAVAAPSVAPTPAPASPEVPPTPAPEPPTEELPDIDKL
jgi:PKD repeat protein